MSNNCIDRSFSVNPPFIGFLGGFFILFPDMFSFGFFKIRSTHFGTPPPSTRLSIVFLGVVAFPCRLNLRHQPSTRRSVSYTRLRVDLTRRRVLFTRPPLQCRGAASPPHPSPCPAFHHSMLCVRLFIEKYGTHIIVGLSIGGQDILLVKQDKSSELGPSELKKHLDELGDQLFTGTCNFSPHYSKSKEKPPQAFNVFDPQPVAYNSFSSVKAKDGISVICFKTGGDPSVNSHCEWLQTVPLMPDAIHYRFIPITSLLRGVPGEGLLSHAINLYLRYKPPIADLQYFLDFQSHKIWAPIHNDLSLGPATNRPTASSTLQFKLMGPKLFVNLTRVTVGKRPVTGMRLYLEGMKCNRLAIHLQHLSNTPAMLDKKIDESSLWRGSEDVANYDQYFEAIHKKFSHICTAPIEYDPRWSSSSKDESFIVTGAQLHVKKHDSKTVLHLRLLFSKVSDSFIVQSTWSEGSSRFSQKSGIFSAISTSISGNQVRKKEAAVVVDSGVFPTGPPVPVQTQKLLKFVDMSQFCKGPQDSPGHWLVTGARLQWEKGKICLHVKFSLLNIIHDDTREL